MTVWGDYELIEEIAHGGMGIVYRARQVSLDRTVAVKVLLAGQFADAVAFQRFRVEAETAARLQHPNIVAIHEIGEQDGQPFYSMDYVAGRTLAEVVRDHPLPARQAGTYLLKISRAVQYAHDHGVLHRDLKPANILIDDHDEPRITDFGLARQLTGDSDLTLTGQILGSPNFMPPEQGRGTHAAVSPASDIYSLGAVLYYLLTARPPFAAETFEATLARVLGEEPLPPRHLNPSVPRDLEILCLKCLEKDPQRRFASASGLADELERFLESRPIQSRPIHLVGKVARWCRRKPALATMSATVVVAVTLGLTGVLTQWRRAERSASAERVHRLEAEHALHRLELQRAGELFASQNAAAGLASLALLLRQDPGNRAVANWLLAELTHRSWPLPVLEALPHPEEAHYAEFSPDGARILTAAMDNAVRLWETASGRPIGSPMQHEPGLVDRLGRDYFEGNLKPIVARFSPDGLRLATGSVDHTARVWDAQTGQPLTPSLPHPDWVTAVAFSPDGARLATACRDGRIRLWRARTGEWLGEPMRHAKCVNFMAFSPDGRRLLTGSDDATAQVWDAETGQPIGKPIRHGRVVKAGQFSPDGRRVATASQDGTARLWDAATGEPLSPPLHHENQVVALAFSPDGGSLATASLDSTVRLWDGLTGAPQGRPLEHGGTVRSVQFSPEGERLLTGAEDKKAYLWDLRTSQLAGEPIQHQDAVWSARFSPDGQRVVTASSDRTAQVWDVRPGAALPRHLPVTSQTHWVHWSPDGHRVLVGAWAPVLFDSATAQAREHKLRGHGHPICANFSPDSRRVLLSYGSEPAQVWDLEAEECVVQFDDRTRAVPACFSPDGRFILTGSGDGTAALREAGSYQLVRSFPHQPTAAVTFAEFSPDGQRVLTESGGTIRLWNPADGLLKAQWPAHAAEITVAHFSPDGRRVVTASKDGTARVWDAASGAPVTPPLRHRGGVHQAAFSPDGARVVTASQDDTARLWDARSGAAMGEPFRHNGAVLWAGFSPEGDRVVTTAEDGTARLWDGRTGQVLASPFKHPFFVNHAEFSPDGTQLATACQGRSGWIWDVPVVEAPVPAWLAELAEAVAGQRTALDRAAEQVPATEFIRLRRVLADASDGQPGDRWLEWFLADRSNRSVGPGASLSVHQAVAAQAQEAAIGSSAPCPQLASWIALHPARAGLWARASRIALEEHRSRSDPALLARAGWFSRRALDLAPTEAAAWWAHADWLAAAGDSADALRAMKTGAQLESASAPFWLAFGAMLERAGRDREALEAYTQAVESDRHQPRLDETERRRALLGHARIHRRQGEEAEALRDHRLAYAIAVPPRDPETPERLLDLSAFYNANLETDWRGMRFSRHNLSTLPRGRQTFGGIEFDLRGAIQLNWGSGSWGLEYPNAVLGIPVGRRCQRIHFLHAAIAANTPGAKPRAYTMRLADGQSFELPIRMDVNVARWDLHPSWDSPGPVVAWEGTSPAGIPVRLFRATWTNPHPEVAVQTLDFTTPSPGDGPILFAVTVE